MRGIVSLLIVLAVSPAAAVTFTVNSTADLPDVLPGDGVCASASATCTLRAAVHETNALGGLDEIVVPAGTYVLTRPNNPLSIQDNLLLRGAGAATTIIDGSGITSVIQARPDLSQDFNFTGTVTIRGLTIQNGVPGLTGGADLLVEDCVIRNNRAGLNGSGGGFAGGGRVIFRNTSITGNTAPGNGSGGGIFYFVTDDAGRDEFLRIEKCEISGNTAGFGGGAIWAEQGRHDVHIVDSTVAGNSAAAGGGVVVGGYISLLVERSTFHENHGYSGGGAIYLTAGGHTIRNSTFTGNVGGAGGAIAFRGTDGGQEVAASTLNLLNVTMMGNRATIGGAIHHDPGDPLDASFGQRLTIRNSILAGSVTGGDCGGAVPVSLGGNISSDSSCGFAATGDLSSTDPRLGPLADNGGETVTHALLTGSPAIHRAATNCPAHDQRNFVRPAPCDSGAFETGASVTATPATGNPGQLYFGGDVTVSEDSEGVSFFVVRDVGDFGPVSAFVTPAGASAAAGADFDATPIYISWADGEGISGAGTAYSLAIPIVDDDVDEPDETFTVSFSGLTGGATVGSPGSITITITDDDEAPLPVPGTLSIVAGTVHELSGAATVFVHRFSGTTGAVSADYSTSPGTASEDVDYQAVTGTLSWADGDSETKTFAVPIIDDAAVEGNETFDVSISNVTGGATLGTATDSITISDDESANPGAIEFASDSFDVAEGGGPVTVTLNRVGGTQGSAGVDLVMTGAASDVVLSRTFVSWVTGDATPKTITVTAVNDDAYDPGETVTLTLDPFGSTFVRSPSAATVTIDDDDDAPAVPVPGTLQWALGDRSTFEANGREEVFVSRTIGNTGAVSVQYRIIPGTAAAGTDYEDASGTLSWPDGDTAPRSFMLRFLEDADVEPSETFTLELFNPTGGAVLGRATSIRTIRNDDPEPVPLPPGPIGFSFDLDVGEGGVIYLVVERDDGGFGAASVDWTTEALTATADVDFLSASGTLEWDNGDSTGRFVSLVIVFDSEVEGPEDFRVVLSNPVGAPLGVEDAIVTILDDDVAGAGAVAFDVATATTAENGGPVVLSVSRTGGSSGAASVQYATAPGTAGAGTDYQTTSDTLTWGAGDATAKTISVPLVNDAIVESDESFSVTLSNAIGAAMGTITTATVTITDDDTVVPQPGSIQFAQGSYSAGEGIGSLTITATRTGGSSGAVSIQYATAPGTAGVADYVTTSGTLTWANLDVAPKSFQVAITDDDLEEGGENFSVALSGATGGAAIGATSSATVTIVDNDGEVEAIPALSEWMLILLAAAFAVSGAWAVRRSG